MIHTPLNYRRQLPYECMANSLCASMEIEASEKLHLDVLFDAAKLDNEIRAFYRVNEGVALTKLLGIFFLQNQGVLDEKSGRRIFLKTYRRIRINQLPYRLPADSINISAHAFGKTIPRDGVVKITSIAKNKSHALVLVDYDKVKGYGILDSAEKSVYYLSPADLKNIFKTGYELKLLNEQSMVKMEMLKQGDTRWNNLKLGKTNYKIGRWGCTVTALCMLLSKFTLAYPTPDTAAKKWVFDGDGLITWRKCDFGEMKFIGRHKNYDPITIEKYANADDKGVIVEVDKYHWLAVNRWEKGMPILYDPLTGEELEGYRPRYRRISGFALFEKI